MTGETKLMQDALTGGGTAAGVEGEELAAIVARLSALLAASERHLSMLPLRVVPRDGKPIIASHRRGNLFCGYIATWQEADLVVATLNALPKILAALAAPPTPRGEIADEARAREIADLLVQGRNEEAAALAFAAATPAPVVGDGS